MNATKKLSAGAWLSIVTCVLSLAALVAYLINTSAAGYFQNATVSNLVLMVVGAAVLEAAAVVLSMVKGAKKVVDLRRVCARLRLPRCWRLPSSIWCLPASKGSPSFTSPTRMCCLKCRRRRICPPPPARL